MHIRLRWIVVAAVVAGLSAAGFGCGTGQETRGVELAVENERLSAEGGRLRAENERLSAANEELRRSLTELRVEGAEQGTLAVENERLRGALETTRITAAEERVLRDRLEDELADEREARIRLEGLRAGQPPPANAPFGGSGGWPLAIGVFALGVASALALAGFLWKRKGSAKVTYTRGGGKSSIDVTPDAMTPRTTDESLAEAEKDRP